MHSKVIKLASDVQVHMKVYMSNIAKFSFTTDGLSFDEPIDEKGVIMAVENSELNVLVVLG